MQSCFTDELVRNVEIIFKTLCKKWSCNFNTFLYALCRILSHLTSLFQTSSIPILNNTVVKIEKENNELRNKKELAAFILTEIDLTGTQISATESNASAPQTWIINSPHSTSWKQLFTSLWRLKFNYFIFYIFFSCFKEKSYLASHLLWSKHLI